MDNIQANPLIQSGKNTDIHNTLAYVRNQLHFINDYVMRICQGDAMELDEHVTQGLCSTIDTSINALDHVINQDSDRSDREKTIDEQPAKATDDSAPTKPMPPKNVLLADAPSDSLVQIAAGLTTLMEHFGVVCENEHARGQDHFSAVNDGLYRHLRGAIEAIEYEAERVGSVPTSTYTCPSCEQTVYGKRGARVACGDCGQELVLDSAEAD